MSEQKTGGPAFPGPAQHEQQEDINEGMTLRDWFAGMALQGILTNSSSDICTPDEYAGEAYLYGDAMIARKEVKPMSACLWSLEEGDYNYWQTSCHNAFKLNEGTPEENNMKFCCYCGKEIEQDDVRRTDARHANIRRPDKETP